MPKNLYIDGVKYREWTPRDEEKGFHPLVKKNYKEIFGQDSVYFDIKPRLYSKSGIGGIPDAYVICLSDPCRWYIVENELSTHDVYEHIVGQVSKFMDLICELENQRELVKALYHEIEQDDELHAYVKKRVGPEIFRFLSDLLSNQPLIPLVIDSITPKLDKALNTLQRIANTQVVELRTFIRNDAESVQAYLFEPLSVSSKPTYSENRTNQTAHQTPSSIERGQLYLKFYQELASRLQEIVPTAVAKPKTQYYCQIPTGIGSVHFEWLFWGNPRRKFGVELHFEKRPKEANLRLIRELEKYKEEIKKETGEEPYFQENWGTICARLYLEKKEGQMTEELKTWAVDKMAVLHSLLQPKLDALK